MLCLGAGPGVRNGHALETTLRIGRGGDRPRAVGRLRLVPTLLPPPKGSTSLILTPENRQVLATMHLYHELKIFLPAPQGGPGFSWAVVSNNTTVLPQTSMLQAAKHPTPERAYEVTFQAAHGGRSTIRFAAIRAGQSEQEPDDLYQVAVGIKSE